MRYQKPFELVDQLQINALIKSSPLATLVVAAEQSLEANHLPLVAHYGNGQPDDEQAIELHAHIPRANPLYQLLTNQQACIAIFHGPQAYMSPSFYATKKEHGRVVPTWNYLTVHVHGTVCVVDDPAWVLEQITRLTNQQEAQYPNPWAVSDAPHNYIQQQLSGLVGLKIRVERMEGKIKASQNQPSANQRSVLEALDGGSANSEFVQMMNRALKPKGD